MRRQILTISAFFLAISVAYGQDRERARDGRGEAQPQAGPTAPTLEGTTWHFLPSGTLVDFLKEGRVKIKAKTGFESKGSWKQQGSRLTFDNGHSLYELELNGDDLKGTWRPINDKLGSPRPVTLKKGPPPASLNTTVVQGTPKPPTTLPKGPSTLPKGPIVRPGLQKLTSETGGFSVDFPVQVGEKVEDLKNGLTHHIYFINTLGSGRLAAFHVSYIDFNENDVRRRTPQETLRAFRGGYRQGVEFEMEKEFTFGPNNLAALEYQVKTPHGYIRERLVLDGGRLYILFIANLAHQRSYLTSPEADRFFNSLERLPR